MPKSRPKIDEMVSPMAEDVCVYGKPAEISQSDGGTVWLLGAGQAALARSYCHVRANVEAATSPL